jgi:hypothetical protein
MGGVGGGGARGRGRARAGRGGVADWSAGAQPSQGKNFKFLFV